jgi:hypothetical protein
MIFSGQTRNFRQGENKDEYVPFEVTISFRVTIFSCLRAFRILTSRIAVIGKPFSSCSVLILFKATISPVLL